MRSAHSSVLYWQGAPKIGCTLLQMQKYSDRSNTVTYKGVPSLVTNFL